MKRDQATDLLWTAKVAHKECFLYATLAQNVTMSVWSGKHPVDENSEEYEAYKGDRVLVTMISRFGDVGIRGRDLEPATNGYHARVEPEHLTDWSRTLDPSDDDKPYTPPTAQERLKVMTTRALLGELKSCQRQRGSYDYEGQVASYNYGSVGFQAEDIKAELATREHIPTGDQAKKARQNKAKKNRGKGKSKGR